MTSAALTRPELTLQALYSEETLKNLADAAYEQAQRDGVVDRCERRQPETAPAASTLVGKKVEVCWQYWVEQEDGRKKGLRVWCPGKITQTAGKGAADALLNKGRRQQLEKASPGSFAALYTWEADAEFGERAGQQWLIFDPTRFKRHGAGGWRLLIEEAPPGPSDPERGCA